MAVDHGPCDKNAVVGHLLTPVQQDVLDALGASPAERPTFDPRLRHELRAEPFSLRHMCAGNQDAPADEQEAHETVMKELRRSRTARLRFPGQPGTKD